MKASATMTHGIAAQSIGEKLAPVMKRRTSRSSVNEPSTDNSGSAMVKRHAARLNAHCSTWVNVSNPVPCTRTVSWSWRAATGSTVSDGGGKGS